MARPENATLARRWFWLCLAVIGASVWAVFQGARSGGFLHWDDNHVIVENWHLRGLTGESLGWMFTDLTYEPRYQPLAWLAWALDYHFFALNPAPYHILNVALHLANTVLVFLLVRLFLRLKGQARTDSLPLLGAALVGALLWGLHPLRVEPVAWATGRRYLQATCFLLLSGLAYLKRVDDPTGRRRGRWLWASVAGFAASLLTYPPVISYLGALVVLDFYLRGRIFWREKIPFAAVTGLVLGVTLWARYHTEGIWEPPVTLQQFGLGSRLAQAAYIWAYYAWKPFLPFHLAPVYTTLVNFRPAELKFLVSAAGVLGVSAGLIWQRRRWPGALALWSCHLLLLVPVLGLTEHPHYANDRYLYVAAIAWSVAFASVLLTLWPRRRWGPLALAVSLAAILAAAGLSAAQIPRWRSNESLFRYQLAQLGRDPYRWEILARLGEDLRTQGRLDEAAACLQESLQVYPSAKAAIALGLILEARGRDDEAVARYQAALHLEPDNPSALANLGSALGRLQRPAEAIGYFRRALRFLPNSPEIHHNLGIDLLATGQPAAAAEEFRRALVLKDDFAAAEYSLGNALRDQGRKEEAIAHYERAIRLQPRFPATENNLGSLLANSGRMQEALAHFQQAVHFEPDNPQAHENLGRALLFLGQRRAGLEQLREAGRLKELSRPRRD